MYYYNNNNEKDDPNNINFDSNQLFGQSFEDLNTMNDNNNPFLNFDSSHSLPSQPFDTSPSPSSGLGQQDFLLSQLEDYNINNNGGSFNFFDYKNPSIYLQDQQQAILLSDPSFLRQQQLLQEQQQKANKMMSEQPVRSNLSAMFSKESPPPQDEPMITSQQQKINKSGKMTKPIPISSSLPSSSSTNGGIDHQRRFNELQARFRINYAKKPTKQQQQADSSAGTSMPITNNELSSSLNDNSNRRKLSLEPTSTSKPILRLNNGKIKMAGGINKSPTSITGMAIPSADTTTTTSNASSFPSRTMPIQIQRVHRANASQPFDLEQRQKRLDDQLVKVDFNDITVSELKEMLRQRGKPATGKKAILLQRLQEEKDMILHARANGIPISNRYAIQQQQTITEKSNSPVLQSPIMDHSASLPDSMYLSSSPNAGIGSLNRSIADMHIGSPPMTSQQSRRFAPYAPRAATITSPQPSNASPLYSSSVPTGSLDMMMMQQQEPQVMRGFNFNKKSYAPFASSALATPDRDDDHNPFDDYKQEKNFDSPNDMEWTDPTLDYMLQQHNGKYKR